MILAVVRSHYKEGSRVSTQEKTYRAGNALAEWLGLHSWVDIVIMQSAENRTAFAKTLRQAR